MKKALFVFVAAIMLLQSCICFSSCSDFKGEANHFLNSGTFYNDIYNLIGSVLAGPNTYKNIFNKDGSTIDFSVDIDNYKLNKVLVNDGKGSASLSAIISPNFDIKSSIVLDAFGEKATLDSIFVANDMLLDFNDSKDPYYFKSTEDKNGMILSSLELLKSTVNNANIVSSKEAYKLNGINFDTNTVEINLNSDTVSILSDSITKMFIETQNLALNDTYFILQELVYTIQSEKLHVGWKRYYDDDKICRETFKIYDNYNQYYLFDIAYAEKNEHSYAEISLKANNGDMVLTVFTLSVDKETKKNDEFTTNAKLIIGDELLFVVTNSGNTNKSQGTAKVNFVTELGEVSLPIDFSFETQEDELVYSASMDNLFISFDMVVKAKVNAKGDELTISKPEEYLDLSKLEDVYHFSYSSKPLFETAFKNAIRSMQGKEKLIPEVMPEDDPYSIDISFDSGEEFETNGEYGKDYIDILLSDNYAFKYHAFADSKGEEKTEYSEYRKNGEVISNYLYADGSKYTQLLKDLTKFEVRYEAKKIIYSEYEEKDFIANFPPPQYQYYQSGKCIYNERELVYERYNSNVLNYYTFVFNEQGEVEIIILYTKFDDSTLYMFVEEISNNVPDNAFDLPEYEKVSIHDYFE